MTFIKKILGIILLFAGLIIIIYSLYSSHNVFTAKTAAPEIFAVEQTAGVVETQGLETQLQNFLQEQLKGILPFDSVIKLFNLLSWSIFAGILIVGGSQISSLGIKLLK